MIQTKVYLYDSSQEENGYRGVDYSANIQQANQLEENITQELDTAEITLCGLNFQKEFDPETKFILDFWEDGQIIDGATRHFVVSRDTVSQPILSDDTYFDHHISLIEPSVIAQKRLVDNIAVTYKLKDVTLKQIAAFPDTKVSLDIESSLFTPSENFGITTKTASGYFEIETTYHSGKYFQLEGSLKIENQNGVAYDDVYNNIENFKVGDEYKANFIIPQLAIMFGVDGTKTFSKLGYASITCKIEEFDLNDELNPTTLITTNFISNSNLGEGELSTVNGWQDRIQGEWLLENVGEKDIGGGVSQLLCYYKKYTETSANAPTYRVENVTIKTDKKYRVSISLYQFPDNIPTTQNPNIFKFTGGQPSYSVKTTNVITSIGGNYVVLEIPSASFLTSPQTNGVANFYTYGVDTGEIVYSSSVPYSALALLQKAIINSSVYEKKKGVYIGDINNSELPFYISNEYCDTAEDRSGLIDDLRAVQIIENFYNQKNLWEIMIDVGHYIHAIPELRFGRDDRFEITFNRLGRTDQQNKNGNTISIYNSRNVENYISATSSYIANMVQLGGIIEEWVVPKTTNETLLVSNNTAEIMVSKPIIELLSVTVKNNTTNETAPLTQFIYEENVYKTLSLDYQLDPNRGIALYYRLGTNIITGGQFQLPQANTNTFTDYTFKKVIWCAFNNYEMAVGNPNQNYWGSINVQGYSFLVKYRTKDDVRQSHIRPDIRKYLVNSKFDKIPEHNQFNNQTDVVVDSVKFGNNMYGTLIKTGNKTYDIIEWNDKMSQVKHKGELYNIKGELFYVAKVQHTYFANHIISSVSFSKDYNELSSVIGIPSEPRFYEISEQSVIRRDIAINDMLLMTDNSEQLGYRKNFVFNLNHISDLMFAESSEFAKYAITTFKGDKNISQYDQAVGQPEFYKDVISPINAYSSENTLTYEWDMVDNYSAGDKVVPVEPDNDVNLNERAFSSLKAVGYTDIYGKSALLDFYVLSSIDSDVKPILVSDIKKFPESPIITRYKRRFGILRQPNYPTAQELSDYVESKSGNPPRELDGVSFSLSSNQTTSGIITYVLENGEWKVLVSHYNILATNVKELNTDFNERGLGLIKDCREAISINYNLQVCTNSDTFVLSPFMFLPAKRNIKIVLLSEEINKLSSGIINNSIIITPKDDNGNSLEPLFDCEITKSTRTSTFDIPKLIVTSFNLNISEIFKDVSEKHFSDNDGYQRIKAFAVICNASVNVGENDGGVATIPEKTQFVFARNIPSDWDKERATKTIYFGSPIKDNIFTNKQ